MGKKVDEKRKKKRKGKENLKTYECGCLFVSCTHVTTVRGKVWHAKYRSALYSIPNIFGVQKKSPNYPQNTQIRQTDLDAKLLECCSVAFFCVI